MAMSSTLTTVRAFLTGREAGSKTRHRNVQGGGTRAIVLGAGDGLLTNVSLVLGVAGASAGPSTVRLAGVAGLLAGAFSMGAGELVSMRAQHEMTQRELQVERDELRDEPEAERRELAGMFRQRGLSVEDAEVVSRILSTTASVAFDAHARFELGIDPEASGAAGRAAVLSFFAFGLGAVLPLLPWFFTRGLAAIVDSIVIGAVAALGLGALIGASASRSVWRSALRQLAVATLAAGVTYGVGHLLGVSAT